QLAKSRLDLVVAGTKDAVVMVEAGAHEVSEAEALGAIHAGHEAIKTIRASIEQKAKSRLRDAMMIKGKLISYAAQDALLDELIAGVADGEGASQARLDLKHIFHDMQNDILHAEVLREKKRLDGRRMDEIRQITCEVGVLPRTHGSAVFTRGETQAMVTTTLGTSADAQIIDFMEESGHKKFMLH